jgi:hypothetical protein
MRKKHQQHRAKPNRLRQLFTRANKVGGQPSEVAHAESAEQAREVEQTPPPVVPRGPENQTPSSQPAEYEAAHGTHQLAKPAWTDRAQAYAAVAIAFFSLVTLFVIGYQLKSMREQSAAMQGQLAAMNRQADLMNRQSDLMAKQLDSMNQSGGQTQQLIEQNKELVGHAGEQAKALTVQANAAQTQANASQSMVGQNERLVRSAEAQAGAMSEQASTAQKQFEITDRAWLAVDVAPGGPLLFRGDSVTLPVMYTVKNVGRSVATKVTVQAIAYAQSDRGPEVFTEPVKRQTALCEQIKRNQTPLDAIAIFPNDTKRLGGSFGLTKQELEGKRVENSNSVFLVLLGCADYMFGDESSHHQTGFIYEIGVRDPAEDPYHPHLVRIGIDVPSDKLAFTKYFFGGDYVN